MKILLITDDFYPNIGGIANVLLNLFKQFEQRQEELYIINPYTKGKDLYDKLIKKNYRIRDLGNFFRRKDFYFYTLFSFLKILRDKKVPFSHRIKLILYLFSKPKIFQLIIENIIQLIPFLKKLDFDIIISGQSGWTLPLCFIISRIFNKKLITIAYGLDFLVINPLSFKTYYFHNTDKIILITHHTKDIMRRIHHLDENKLEVIYVGIDINTLEIKETKSELRKEFDVPDDNFVILSVGRHVSRKNFQLVLKAVYEIKKSNPSLKIKYYLIGEGEETINLKTLVKKLKLQNEVKFLGVCDIETRNKFYKLSDLFVMPSLTKKNDIEGFGIVFLEANYYRVPVIGTATGGIIEAIVDGESGFLIKPNDLNDLIDKIILLSKDEQIRKKLGENGYQRVIREFKWENIVNDYIRLFKDLLEN